MKITSHAYKQGKKRMSWSKDAVSAMAARAFVDGIMHKTTRGSLKRYISSLSHKHKRANNIRIYGQDIFIFCDDNLVTLYRLPQKYAKRLANSKTVRNVIGGE